MHETSLKGMWSGSSEPEEIGMLNALIVYDDLPAGRRALRLLTSQSQALGEPPPMGILSWRFDLLDDPDWSAMALRDAARADLLIVAAGTDAALPPALVHWLKVALEQKRGSTAAVVALLEDDELNSPRFRQVGAMSERAGVDFLAPWVPAGGCGAQAASPRLAAAIRLRRDCERQRLSFPLGDRESRNVANC